MHIEDQTAPIKRDEISQMLESARDRLEPRAQLAAQLMGYLNEKRDSYNGVISSLVYIIDADDELLLDSIKCKLLEYIGTDPMRYGGKVFITRCLPRLTTERPKFIAEFFARFLRDEYRQWEGRITNQTEILRIKIIALKAINQVKQKAGVKVADIPGELIDSTCDQAIVDGDDTTKIDTLYILLDTIQATKILQDRELTIFQTVFKETLNFQVPALRQKFLAITNKLLKRIRDSIRVVQREKIRFTDCDRETVTTRYMNFLKWMIEFCLDNIYCNKYFGSFIITMNTLSHVIEHITLSHPYLPIGPLLMSRRFYDSMLSCLALDSFEDNKVMALRLLLALPNSDQMVYENNLKMYEKIAYELVNSVNPAHSMTCQYIFKLIIGVCQNHTKAKKNSLVYKHLDKLVGLVEAGVQETKQDFISTLKNNAIYPKLTCIRALLDEINLKELDEDREGWEQLVERLVRACIESSQAVSSIVCNMNPETIGHLPMDLKPIDNSMLSAGSQQDEQQQTSVSNTLNTITSQHLLITGWKTIKECSLSMGAMCSVFWWPEDDKKRPRSQPILRTNHIEAIIDYFEHYLRNLRHRGAFEQAYGGFIMVTKRIWLDASFKSLLLNNLNKTMEDFKSGEEHLSDERVDYLKRHVTRRSAGLPFLVQAIVVSEHRNESDTLRSVMDLLIVVSKSQRAEAYQKIHCLNILKALITDFNLGEKVTPYVGQVLLITIDAFKSDNFSIRNCASMLMRALVDRIFGVSRLRDEIHKRNTLSYEKFFTDNPDLHARFVSYLMDGLRDRRSFASVHSVFIVLFRLRPSLNPSDGFTIGKIVQPFIEPIYQLALSCPDFKLRELAAKLFVQLEIHRINEEHSMRPLSKINLNLGASINHCIDRSWCGVERNMFHGTACILKSWVELQTEIKSTAEREQIYDHVRRFLRRGMQHKIFTGDKDVQYQCATTLWTIALDLLERYFMIKGEDPVITQVIAFLFDEVQVALAHNSQVDLPEGQKTLALFGPLLESLIFKVLSIGLAILPRQDGQIVSNLFDTITNLVTKGSNPMVSVNLQAACLRLIRQFLGAPVDFVDKVMANLDLDLTAAHMTPVDRLNQRSELDTEKELWIEYCTHSEIRHAVESKLGDHNLKQIFQYESYGLDRELKHANSPLSIEFLALALKGWSTYGLEKPRFARDPLFAQRSFEFLSTYLEPLPDCDLKCLMLLAASNYFKAELRELSNDITKLASPHDTSIISDEGAIVRRRENLRQFTVVLDEMADGHHDRMIRETCSEALNNILATSIEFREALVDGAMMNLLSALIKLCQDEVHDIRHASSRVLSTLSSSLLRNGQDARAQVSANDRLDNLIELISTKLFDPTNSQDALSFFALLTRVIFNHTKAALLDVNEDRESVFDKTKPNIFADHVATIHNTLSAASKFFRRSRRSHINLDSLQLSQEVLEELASPVMTSQIDHTIGDYSWRLRGGPNSEPESKEAVMPHESNKVRVDKALGIVKQSLDYFNYWSMLTDTSFGYHEASIFKRLAFVRLLLECTDYNNEHMIGQIQQELEQTIATSCATTILCKSQHLLNGYEQSQANC